MRRAGCLLAIALVLIVVVGGGAFAAARLFTPAPEQQPDLATVTRGSVKATVNGSGSIVPPSQTTLAFRTSGRVTEIPVKVGDQVKAKQVLARMDPDAKDVDSSLKSLVAPFDGVVTAINGQVGDTVGSGTISQAPGSRAPLPATAAGGGGSASVGQAQGATAGSASSPTAPPTGGGLISLDEIGAFSAVVSFAEVDVVRLANDQKATLTFDAVPGLELPGHVVGLAPTGFVSGNVVKYYATVALDRQDGRLRPPMSASASVVVAAADDVLKVPNSSLRHSQGKTLAVLYTGGRQSTVEVTPGVVGESETEIKSGLKEGDKVLLQATPLPSPPSGVTFG